MNKYMKELWEDYLDECLILQKEMEDIKEDIKNINESGEPLEISSLFSITERLVNIVEKLI